MAKRIPVEEVLRFKITGSNRVVQVATDRKTMRLLVALLKEAAENGKGIPAGTIKEGATYELSDEPGWLVSSDGTRISPIPREPITFPAVPRLASWKK